MIIILLVFLFDSEGKLQKRW